MEREWGTSAPAMAPGDGMAGAPPGLARLGSYVARLDRLVSEAREGTWDQAARSLSAVPPPDGVVSGHLLERKRRELLARFDRVRTEHLRVPVDIPGVWPELLQRCAELAGLPWGACAGCSRPARDDAGWLGFTAPHDRGEVLLDLAGGWLTLHGPPLFVQEAQRLVDRRLGCAPLALHVQWDQRRDWLEGGSLAQRVQLTNISGDTLVLAEIGSADPHALPESLARASLGRLSHDPSSDSFLYDPAATGSTPPCFYSVVLRPGQSRTLVWNLELGGGGDQWRSLQVRHARFDEAAFQKAAYVPGPRAGFGFPAAIPYQHPAPSTAGSAPDWGTVLLPEVPAGCWHTSTWAVPYFVAGRPFSLAAAQARLGRQAEGVHYSRWQQAWVLAEDGGTTLVGPGRIEHLPRIAPACYVVVDAGDQRVGLRVSPALVSRVRPALLGVPDWESHALGLAVHLPRSLLPTLWNLVDSLALRLMVGRDLLGRPILALVEAEG